MRQISGLLARRIVCALRPGQTVSRGEKFGMIKLGSRTELILPRDAVRVDVERRRNGPSRQHGDGAADRCGELPAARDCRVAARPCS